MKRRYNRKSLQERAPHIQKRWTVKRQAAKELRISIHILKWLYGRLCFVHNNKPVPNMPMVLKPKYQ